MSDLHKQADRANRWPLISLMLLVVLPAYSVAGWMIWLASAERPWLMSFGFAMAVLFLFMWPLEFWLERQQWFTRMTGGGRFQQRLLKYLTFLFPCLIIVGVNDLDHKRAFADNLHEYVLTIIAFLALLSVVESAVEAAERYWKRLKGAGPNSQERPEEMKR